MSFFFFFFFFFFVRAFAQESVERQNAGRSGGDVLVLGRQVEDNLGSRR